MYSHNLAIDSRFYCDLDHCFWKTLELLRLFIFAIALREGTAVRPEVLYKQLRKRELGGVVCRPVVCLAATDGNGSRAVRRKFVSRRAPREGTAQSAVSAGFPHEQLCKRGNGEQVMKNLVTQRLEKFFVL
jgi:hypothetical protein